GRAKVFREIDDLLPGSGKSTRVCKYVDLPAVSHDFFMPRDHLLYEGNTLLWHQGEELFHRLRSGKRWEWRPLFRFLWEEPIEYPLGRKCIYLLLILLLVL